MTNHPKLALFVLGAIAAAPLCAINHRPFTEADRKIAGMLSSYWANFTATGDPNGKGLPHWPALSEQPGSTMELGNKPGAIPVAGDQAKLSFWREYFARRR